MLLKLAFRNMNRSVRDYVIYFITLLVAVTIFYAFNSVQDQQVMHEIAASNKASMVELTGYLLGIFSVVVALVLGFLVIYSNQLLVARRKHEFGIYLTLGMRPGQISRILMYETVLIGLLSLAAGIALGVLASQLLSFATAALFGVPLPNYQFVFSVHAFIATLGCFIAIYVVVAIFNVISIRRHKLIDLINASRKSQKVAIRNPWVCLAVFVISIAMLAYAYQQLSVNGMVIILDDEFKRATVFMLLGTLLFFFSLAGFVIAVFTHAKGAYYRKLRPFTTRQVASKINSSFASIWIVCVLLFFAITTFATGMSLVSAFTGDIDRANPYDLSITNVGADMERVDGEWVAIPTGIDTTQAQKRLESSVTGWNDTVRDSTQLDFYQLPDLTYGDIMQKTGTTVVGDEALVTADRKPVEVIGLSQFNDALELQGKRPVTLASDQYLVTNNMATTRDIADGIVTQKMPLATPAGELLPLDHVENAQLYDYSMLSTALLMVVPDEVVRDLAATQVPSQSTVNIMYVNGSASEDAFFEGFKNAEFSGHYSVMSRLEMVGQAMGMRVAITYLAVYIGLVLLIATAAVLAIQLLSLTIDSLGRYKTLSKIGCSSRMLGGSLFTQVVIYFCAPLVLATCHSAWTIHLLSDSLLTALGIDLLPTILLSAGLVLLIYGGYLIVTYLASRATVRQALGSS